MSLADSADVTQSADDGSVDHLWSVLPNGDGTVRIVNRNSGKVLAVRRHVTASGAYVQQYQDNGTADHDWTLRKAGGGLVKIVNADSRRGQRAAEIQVTGLVARRISVREVGRKQLGTTLVQLQRIGVYTEILIQIRESWTAPSKTCPGE